ncbi:MAG: hypothetical protein GW912_07510 [Zetaproteobacteria bacterium]|nr:hypothetical protein [Flavobacteriales bacterium]
MKNSLLLLFICILFIQCQSDKKHLIQKSQVGFITKDTKVSDLDQLFETDSLVKPVYQVSQPKSAAEYYEVYAKNGDHLLTINIENSSDTSAIIQNVLIFSGDFHTKSKISVLSLFKDLKEKYQIEKVETAITSATVFVEELNATFNIGNKDLGLSEFSTDEVKVEQIPDNAPFRYITVWFN